MERVASLLANEFVQNASLKVHLVTLVNQDQFYSLSPKVEYHKPVGDKSWNFFTQAIQAVVQLRGIMKKLNPDGVICFGDRYNALTVLASLAFPVNVFVSNRQNPLLSNGRFIDIVNWLLYRFSSGMIAQTLFAKEIFIGKYGVRNIVVIGNPFKLPSKTYQGREKIILNVGRFGDSKNQHELIEIFEKTQSVEKWNLIFVGDGYKKQQTLEKLYRSPLQERIRIEGFTTEIAKYYDSASIFAFTSRSEGFPNALGEAMAHGCACISYNCFAGPSDIIDNGINGFLIPEGDHVQYRQKLQELMDDPALRERFGKLAREKMKQFSLEKVAQQYLDFVLEDS